MGSVVFLTGCMEYSLDDLGPTTDAKNMGTMVAPLKFQWNTLQNVKITTKGIQTSSNLQSTLSISGKNGSYYKALNSISQSQEFNLAIPSDEKSFTVTFDGGVQTVSIVGGTAVIDFTKFTQSQQPSPTMRSTAAPADRDGDGVADRDDDFPTDANKAYSSSFPSANTQGTLAFEDNWPAKADYDFNDVVVDYNINTVTNAQNQVVEVIGTFTLKASGANFNNGFGFQLDNIAPNKITSVSGASYTGYPTFVNNAANGLESGQTFANCIVFDQFRVSSGAGGTINTEKSKPFVAPRTVTVTMSFIKNGVAPAGGTVALNDLPFNLFNFYIIVSGNRGLEIHLPDRVPTSFANRGLFGQQDDDSAGSSRFYRTQNNLPWAINVVQGFDYPIEGVPMDDAYLHLIRWAESSGAEFSDWYSNRSGFRNNAKIY